jgi:protein-tyrosine phosphatase
MVDLHTHVMFGWDDGAGTIEDSVAMARLASDNGTRIMAATPHLVWSGVTVDPQTIRDRVAQLNERIAQEGIDIRIVVGCEVPALWDHFNLIKHKKVLTLGEGSALLFEVPSHQHPLRFADLIFQVRMTGLTPLMAHPERSTPFLQNHDLFRATIDESIPVQITAGSLLGAYGKSVGGFAWEIVRQERPIVIASDGHGVEHRRPRLGSAHAMLAGELGEEAADLMCRGNPAALLEGNPIQIARISRKAPPEGSRGLAGRIRRALRRD